MPIIGWLDTGTSSKPRDSKRHKVIRKLLVSRYAEPHLSHEVHLGPFVTAYTHETISEPTLAWHSPQSNQQHYACHTRLVSCLRNMRLMLGIQGAQRMAVVRTSA